MGVAENLQLIKEKIPAHVTLVAVSKTKPDEAIMEAYRAGHRDFGENKVQELMEKRNYLNEVGGYDEIRWHLIGHLQRNKARQKKMQIFDQDP